MTRKIVLGVAAAVVAVVVGLVVLIAVQPNEFRVSRSATMNAPADEVFAQVNDFHNWEAWSPWAKLDPNATYSFEGPTSGEGAVFRWSGNDSVGEGSMTILESQPGKLVRYRLDFLRPMEDTATGDFVLQPDGEGTKVTWSMYGQQTFFGKAISLVMDCEKLIGGPFEEGLARMKEVVERVGERDAIPDAT